MTKTLQRALDKMKTGDAMSAAVTAGGYCVARIDNGMFVQRKKAPVGFGWRVQARCSKTAEIYITPRDKATLILKGEDETPHIRIDFPARKEVARG